MITSTTRHQFALEDTSGETADRGVFTSAIIEGLATGSADLDHDGLVSANDLYNYLERHMRELNENQTPTLSSDGSGMVILAKVKNGATAGLGPPVEQTLDPAEPDGPADEVAGDLSSLRQVEEGLDFSDMLAGGISEDLVKADEGIPVELDYLGMSTYVGMLATVIARTETPLPLSIGLFGSWGSGKSYFMGLLRDRVQALASSASPDYHDDIVQIGFNAWSYADSNLWASLGDEIFRQLASPTAKDADSGRPAELRKELRETMDRAKELKAAKEKVDAEAKRLHAELAEARATYTSSLTALARATVQAGTEQGLESAWVSLGLNNEAERVQALVDETRGAVAEAGVIRQTVRNRVALGSVVVGVMALVALLVFPLFADNFNAWVSGASMTAFLAAVATFTAGVGRAQSALRTVREVAAGIRGRIAENSDDRFKDDVTAVRDSEARQELLQAQLDEVVARAGEISRELVDLDPGRRLYGFLAERASSGDYAGQLGLISTIRRDLQQLRNLMQEWRDEPATSTRRPIDRIVLYIDDLDRCSPAQVVDVLQAVHLLLAMDLFVVVVGVDPRWLLSSLRREYRQVLTPDDVPVGGNAEGEASWQSTPGDYLEKIFNIPFVLPTMTPGTYTALIERLTSRRGTPSTSRSATGATTQDGYDESTHPGDLEYLPNGQGDASVLTAESGSEVAAQTEETPSERETAQPPPRPLTKPELDLLYALSPFVDTPREAKRLLNVYRMLRSTQDLSDASRFIGTAERPGDYQAAAVLLGLLTGHPLLLGEILYAAPDVTEPETGGLCSRQSADMTWADFVDSLYPREHEGGWRNSLSAGLSTDERAQWVSLIEAARPSLELVALPDLTAFRYWGPHVSRFSFLLSTRDRADSAASGP